MSQIVRIFMLMGVLALCGFGYIYITANLGISDKIVGNASDNATLMKENSTFYDQGKGLLVGSDLIGWAILIIVILLFLVMLMLALRDAGYL